MAGTELSRPMRILVEDLSTVRPNEQAVVLADETRLGVARSLVGALRAAGATASLMTLPYEERGGVEPPSMAAAAMAEADSVFVCTANNITHTDAHRNAQAAGTQIASMWGVTEETFLQGPSPENYEAVDRNVRAVRDRLEGTTTVHVTTPAGTDISFSVADRPPIALGIEANDKSTVADFPQGEVAVAPVEGTAEGTVVVDVGLDVIGLVEEPVTVRFEAGRATAIDGGPEASHLRRLVAEADEHARNLAEFAVGTNPDARRVDHIRETKKQLGTIHLALGDSATIGGTVESDLHVDCILAKPTVQFDDETILEDGTLVM